MSMKWNQTKGTTLGSIIALSLCMGSLLADNPYIAAMPRETKKPQSSPVAMAKEEPCINTSLNYFTADLLIWQANQEGIPLSVTSHNYNPDIGYIRTPRRAKNMTFGWDAGFRLGYDRKLGDNGWDLNATWLRFFTDAHRNPNANSKEQFYPSQTHPFDVYASLGDNAFIEATDNGTNVITNGAINIAPVNIGTINNGANNSYDRVHAYWYGRLNQLDIALGRAFQPAKSLRLRPNFGVRATWLQQRLRVAYHHNNGVSQIFQLAPIDPHSAPPFLFELEPFQAQGDEFTVKKKNTWFGVGPVIGMDTGWTIGSGFTLFGNIALAVESGFHKTWEKDTNSTHGVTEVNMGNFFRTSHPILDLQLGLTWDKLFCSRYSVGLTAMWENHIYFSQNQFPLFVDSKSLGTFTTNGADLTYHGVTLRLNFGF